MTTLQRQCKLFPLILFFLSGRSCSLNLQTTKFFYSPIRPADTPQPVVSRCCGWKSNHSSENPYSKNVQQHRSFQSRSASAFDFSLSSIPLACEEAVAFFPSLPGKFFDWFQDTSSIQYVAQSPALIAAHILFTNTVYLLRRSLLRNMPKRTLFQIRLTREDGVGVPLYVTNLLVWQIFVTVLFPIIEPFSRIMGYVSFYYFYPNANGLGIIFEPLSVQHLSMSKRAKHQIRFDWHRFSVNVGKVGRDGYRHPPSVERNLPHLDVPMFGWKHWPWRRNYNVGIFESDRKM